MEKGTWCRWCLVVVAGESVELRFGEEVVGKEGGREGRVGGAEGEGAEGGEREAEVGYCCFEGERAFRVKALAAVAVWSGEGGGGEGGRW